MTRRSIAFSPCWIGDPQKPRFPPTGVFSLTGAYPSATAGRPDRQSAELIDGVTAGTPVRVLLFVEALGRARIRFARVRADHRAGVEPAAIDAHRSAEAAGRHSWSWTIASGGLS
jgi:hypothetical protein